MIALLEKLFNHWKFLVAVAFVGFLICIIASLMMMRTISLNVGSSYEEPRHEHEDRLYKTALCSFLLAIGALVVFVIRNLLLG